MWHREPKIKLIRVNQMDVDNPVSLRLLKEWRIKNKFAYVGDYEITEESIRKWLLEYVLAKKDRRLYWVCVDGVYIGTLGESHITKNSVELSDVSRGVDDYPGVFHKAMDKLLAPYLVVYLQVRSDNKNAIDFYKKNGFVHLYTEGPYICMIRQNFVWERRKRNVH
jgi:RimJ/RimL family protein N-acetyltransferase